MALQNQYSFWYTGQVVTQSQMEDFTNDLYLRFSQLTQSPAPCILYLDGSLSQTINDISVPAGAFRFNNLAFTVPGTTDLDTAVFGIGEADTITVAPTDNGYIVAQYTLNGSTPNPYNLTVAVNYAFTATPLTTDCIIVAVTDGNIGSLVTTGNSYINTAATNTQVQNAIDTPSDAVNNVALTPANLQTIFDSSPSSIAASSSALNVAAETASNLSYVNVNGNNSKVAIVANTTPGEDGQQFNLSPNTTWIFKFNFTANVLNAGQSATCIINEFNSAGININNEFLNAAVMGGGNDMADGSSLYYISSGLSGGSVYFAAQNSFSGSSAVNFGNILLEITQIS